MVVVAIVEALSVVAILLSESMMAVVSVVAVMAAEAMMAVLAMVAVCGGIGGKVGIVCAVRLQTCACAGDKFIQC